MLDPFIFNAASSAKAEQIAELTTEWLEVIYREKWFQLFVPQELGGLGASLPTALKIEEELAFADGSLGWTVTLCAGAGWFVGFMEKDLRQEVFQDRKVCLAGSGFVGGKADLQGEEYLVSGSWTYASGALHATHFTANCELLKNGKAIVDEIGNPVAKAFILKKEEVKILDGWNYMGMIATGSHAFKTENLRVPLNRAFEILPEKATSNEPIYRYPFLQFAEVTLAVNILGITRHLVELIEKAFKTRHAYRKYDTRHLDYFEKVFEKQDKKLKSLKKEFYSAIGSSWKELQEEGKISKSSLKKISRISRKLTQNCREISGKLYPFAGLEAAKTHTELNRVWRDFNTVSQHALLIFPF
jgi:alkylation response protein AidB-like acyl-CoA dehydrogenase